MRREKMKSDKGFTLVELLIVIVIIGILAAAMLLSSRAAEDGAEAAKVISDLRNVKAAVLMYYTEHQEWPGSTAYSSNTPPANLDIHDLARYLDGGGLDPTRYSMISILPVGAQIRTAHHDANFVGLAIKTDGPAGKAGVQERLAQRAASVGLVGVNGQPYTSASRGNVQGMTNYLIYMIM